MRKIFDGKKALKLGTEKNPVTVTVKTKKRAKEIQSQCDKHGWQCDITVDSKQAEDITDLEVLLNTPQTVVAEKKPGRNDPCPCGSGKKYKKCCG